MSRLDRVIADFTEYGDARIVPVDPELVLDLARIAEAAWEYVDAPTNHQGHRQPSLWSNLIRALAIFEESNVPDVPF